MICYYDSYGFINNGTIGYECGRPIGLSGRVGDMMSALKLAAAIVMHEGNILVVKRSGQERFLPGNWGVPCGKVDVEDGEKSRQAVLRELFEETGLDAKIICFAGRSKFYSVWRGSRKKNVQRNYLVRPVPKSASEAALARRLFGRSQPQEEPEVKLPVDDQDYRWVPEGALSNLEPDRSLPNLEFGLDAHNLGAIRQGLRVWHLIVSLRRFWFPGSPPYRRTGKTVFEVQDPSGVVEVGQEIAQPGVHLY